MTTMTFSIWEARKLNNEGNESSSLRKNAATESGWDLFATHDVGGEELNDENIDFPSWWIQPSESLNFEMPEACESVRRTLN